MAFAAETGFWLGRRRESLVSGQVGGGRDWLLGGAAAVETDSVETDFGAGQAVKVGFCVCPGPQRMFPGGRQWQRLA